MERLAVNHRSFFFLTFTAEKVERNHPARRYLLCQDQQPRDFGSWASHRATLIPVWLFLVAEIVASCVCLAVSSLGTYNRRGRRADRNNPT
jgi:hypothetical protein